MSLCFQVITLSLPIAPAFLSDFSLTLKLYEYPTVLIRVIECLLGPFVCMCVTNVSRVSRKKYCCDILVGIKMTVKFIFHSYFSIFFLFILIFLHNISKLRKLLKIAIKINLKKMY